MIEIRNLDFSYKKSPVFNNINLTFPQGCIYGLLGENGVGKTTLLKLICGLLRPVHGTVTLDGLTAHDRQPEMLQRIVFLPDEVSLPDNSTPQRYVDELMPFYPNFAQGTFLHLMQELEVTGKLLKESGRQLRTVYIGGGTPTTLSSPPASRWAPTMCSSTSPPMASTSPARPSSVPSSAVASRSATPSSSPPTR